MLCSGILGSEKLQSGFALCAIFSTPHFFVSVKYFVFSLSDTKKRQLGSLPLLRLTLWYALFALSVYKIKNYVNPIHALLYSVYPCYDEKLMSYLITYSLFLAQLRITQQAKHNNLTSLTKDNHSVM
jgi:hypothetical protein